MRETLYLKCGKTTYELIPGDTVMDNGSSFQFVSRRTSAGRGRRGGWILPVVPKAAAVEFIRKTTTLKKVVKYVDSTVSLVFWVHKSTTKGFFNEHYRVKDKDE